MTNRVDQPRPLDLVGNPIHVSGIATGFEATLEYRIGDGHHEVTGTFTAGGGSGELGQFHVAVDVHQAPFQLDRLLVQVFEARARDGGDVNAVTIPVIYGPRIVPGYYGYREHKVVKGDTLSALAKTYYGDAALYSRIVRANPAQITDPDKIVPGQVFRIPIGS
ncbi:Gmad2 immunoglobulin-like domain-containing protein [Streptomyces sp. NPDC023838]|uniref:Gmad2 immunoglobulin-like domain-containing protein n=1 Tax=Streptomyces sp. NPDC023838 TaxID=3154325 RepID=UPI0033DE137D